MSSPPTAPMQNGLAETPQKPPSPTFGDKEIAPSIEDEHSGIRRSASQKQLSSPTSPPPEDRMPDPVEEASNANKRQKKPQLRLPTRHITPRSSLPPWRYFSHRLKNEFARSPSAMSHRARTPIVETPQRPGTPITDNSDILDEHGLHGDTTYTSMPLEQMELDPRDPDQASLLGFTDDMPMAGWFLHNSRHRSGIREQAKAFEINFEEYVDATRDANERH